MAEELVVRGEHGDSDLLIGVHWLRGDTCGEKAHLSLWSVSVPYPLSISVGRARRCFNGLNAHGGEPNCDFGMLVDDNVFVGERR